VENMDGTFHYYAIKLICLGLGMPEEKAETVAHASNYVDYNNDWVKVDGGLPTEFSVVPTFSIDLIEGTKKNYPTLLLHFPPGDGVEGLGGNPRKDGNWFEGITTPGAKMAQEALDLAIESGDLEAIGAALHPFADTWAHQGFAGCKHKCNKMENTGKYEILPEVGHGENGHINDEFVISEDGRYKENFCKINNKTRFQSAAKAIAKKLFAFIHPKAKKEEGKKKINEVLGKIFGAWGEPIPVEERKENEIKELEQAQIFRLRSLGIDSLFGGKILGIYDNDKLQRDSIFKKVKGFNDEKVRKYTFGLIGDYFFPDQYYWQFSKGHNIIVNDYETHKNSKFSTPFNDYINNEIKEKKENSEDIVKLFDINDEEEENKKPYFETFLPLGDNSSQKWPSYVKAIESTNYFKFHTAVQGLLGHFIYKTKQRKAYDEEQEKKISLYEYYDPNGTEEWVEDLQLRTYSLRKSMYGDKE
jgi:hypothetical protein